MKCELIDKVKKFKRTKGWIKSILSDQKDYAENMLDVIKSDGENKLSIHRVPSLKEWKNVYTSMGWKYVENGNFCYNSTPLELTDPFDKGNNKKISINPTSHYDEVVFNYETYQYCKQEVRHTQLILERLESSSHNDDLLDFDSINHDEALCFLLGINANLTNTLTLKNEKLLSVFDYEVDFYDVSINGLLFRSKEHQLLKRKFGTSTINTKEFTDWAIDKKYIKLTQERRTHAKTIVKNKNIDIVKKSLIEYLPTIDKATTKHNLSLNKDFLSILKKGGLNVEEYGMSANEIKLKKHTTIAHTTLDNYLEKILDSDWWNNDSDTSKIRKKLKKPLKSKSKKITIF